MLSDEFPEYDAAGKAPMSLGATTFTRHVGFADAADVDAAMAKAAAGCAVAMAAIGAFWRMRWGRLKDPFGHAWALGAPLPGKSEKAS